MRQATCHPDRESYERGLCRECTNARRRGDGNPAHVTVPATCHPERQSHARGRCYTCYMRLETRVPCPSCRQPMARTSALCRACSSSLRIVVRNESCGARSGECTIRRQHKHCLGCGLVLEPDAPGRCTECIRDGHRIALKALGKRVAARDVHSKTTYEPGRDPVTLARGRDVADQYVSVEVPGWSASR